MLLIGGELNPAIVVKKTPSATRVQRFECHPHLRGEQQMPGPCRWPTSGVTDDKCAPGDLREWAMNTVTVCWTAVANGESYP